jgi:hypothetical protein
MKYTLIPVQAKKALFLKLGTKWRYVRGELTAPAGLHPKGEKPVPIE